MANDKLMSSLNAEFMAELGRELERLENLVSVLVKRNDRMREALTRALNEWDSNTDWRDQAKEALK